MKRGWCLLDVDMVDCSSGGIAAAARPARIERSLGLQVPFAERVRHEADVKTMAVGLIPQPEQAEAILQRGRADLIAIDRQALFDPNRALHAEFALGVDNDSPIGLWSKDGGSTSAGRRWHCTPASSRQRSEAPRAKRPSAA